MACVGHSGAGTTDVEAAGPRRVGRDTRTREQMRGWPRVRANSVTALATHTCRITGEESATMPPGLADGRVHGSAVGHRPLLRRLLDWVHRIVDDPAAGCHGRRDPESP